MKSLVLVALAACAAPKAPAAPAPNPAPPAAPVPPAPPAPATQAIDGRWHGEIMSIGLTVRFDNGAGTMDVPKQGASGLPLSNVSVTGDDVAFEVAAAQAKFRGKLAGDTITGTWTQHGQNIALTLTRGAAPPAATADAAHSCATPPVDDLQAPYHSIEVAIDSTGGTRLAGTLVVPAAPARAPVVVMVTGSGPEDRDECIFGIRPFRQLADYLARHGIASLRYDDRGTAKSTGTFDGATVDDFTADALAAVKFLETRAEIDPHRIGVLGHSEGGIIAPLAATRDRSIAFIVLWAGPGVPMFTVMEQQVGAILRAQGASEDTIAKAVAAETAVLDAVRTSPDAASLEAALRVVAAKQPGITDVDNWAHTVMQQLGGPWLRWYIHYDPAATLAKVRCPVLALAGSLDTQVPPADNLPALRKALAHNRHATIRELPGLNHPFQRAKTGAPNEYTTLPPTIDDAVLDATTSWIAGLH